MKPKSKVLIIAGSDSSGGAGIQADIKTVTSLGSYAMTAITAVTSQNTTGVKSIVPIKPKEIFSQIVFSAKDINPNAVKIGMLHSKQVIQTVIKSLKKIKVKKVVLDPVMVAKSGTKLINNVAINYLKNKLIGGVSLSNQRENSKWELGYWIGEEYWGNGYAIEACENLISYFFSNTNNSIIYASHMKDNIKSKKIIIKLGFKLVGSGKKFSISRNEMVEDLNYELRKS